MKGRSLASDDHVANTWGANYEVAGSKPRQTKKKEAEKRKNTGRTATVRLVRTENWGEIQNIFEDGSYSTKFNALI